MVRTLTVIMSLGVLLVAGTVQAGVAPDALCKEKKAKAAGKKAADLMKAFGKNIKKTDTAKLAEDVSKAQSKFTKAFTKAEGAGGCDTNGDAAAIEAKVDAAVSDLVADLTNICGDNARAGIEQCDGTDASECQGVCLPNCTCPEPICGNGAKEEGEACDPPCEKGACGDGQICGGFCQCVADLPCDCGSPDPTMYQFTTKAPTQAVCGTTDGGPPLDELACMGMYLGGGGGSMAVPNMLPDEATVKYNVECCQGTNLAITPKTQAEVGKLNCGEGKRCSSTSENAGAPCRRDRNCPGGFCETHCFFAAPLEVFDQTTPPISVCADIEVIEDSLGGVDCGTGEKFTRLPIDARLYLTGFDKSPSTPGFQACPICFGGTLGIPGSGICEGGPNNGLPCTPQSTAYDVENCCEGPALVGTPCSDDSDCPGNSCIPGCTQYPTSHDCPPNPLTVVGVIPISFALTTEASSKTANANGDFCGWCRDVEVEGTYCFEGDPDDMPSPGGKSCPDSATVACRPTTFYGPGGGDAADMAECSDPVPCSTDADCSAPYETCEQRNPGAFRDATVRNISYQGTRGGDLRTLGSHRGTTVSAFCVGPSFNTDADFSGDVGGPAGVSLEVDMQLSP